MKKNYVKPKNLILKDTIVKKDSISEKYSIFTSKILILTLEIRELERKIMSIIKEKKLLGKLNQIKINKNYKNSINKQDNVNLILTKKMESTLNEKFNSELKHFPSSVREWNNSIYLYNKNNLNLIPFTTTYATKIIKSFFNLYNKILEKKIRSKRLLLRLRRLSSNRIYLSGSEFKHSNNNVLINIYVFNRQKHNYLSKLKKIYLKKFLAKKGINNIFIKLFRSIHKKGLDSIKEINQNKYSLIKALNIIEKNKDYKINIFKNLSNYTINFYKNLIDLTMKRLRLYFLYKQLVYINKSKLNYTYLHLLKKHMESLYNKNVEFNLINLKRFYLNSDILSESVKLKLTRNKKKMRKMLNKLKDKVKIQKKKQILTVSLFKNRLDEINNSIWLRRIIFEDLKYKHVTGFRLEARGRLSKRYTASRSVSKLKYKGNLLNIDSSYKGLSSVILKGNLKSNIQYTKSNSKTRIGTFGIKGWISGN